MQHTSPTFGRIHRRPGRRARAAAVVLALAALVQGCGGAATPTASKTPTSSASATPSPPAPNPAPKLGECRSLTFEQATVPTDDTEAIACAKPHTAVTFFVGNLDRIVDGHLAAVDSATVRDQLATTCRGRLTAFLGGGAAARRASQFEVVWFRPTVEDADRGANWYRCDAVALESAGKLSLLPRQTRNILASDEGRARFGICGTAAPDSQGFRRIACAQEHSWRVASIIDLPAEVAYLDADAGANADASCKDLASNEADGALKFTWSFEWPARPQWAEGQRYGYCWLPA